MTADAMPLTQDALAQIRARANDTSADSQVWTDRDALLAEVDRLRAELDREDASHTRTIIDRDEAEAAMQRLDVLTGGDGEYRASTIDPDAPATPALMAKGISERYVALKADRDAAVARAEKVADFVRSVAASTGGEGLRVLADELLSEIGA